MSFFNIFKSKKEDTVNLFISPTNGELLDLKDVPDEVFSNKMMGDGFAIKSNDGIIYSPVDGVIEMIFNTKHAIGIKSNNNLEILIHLGIDTVKLNGEGFEVFVSEKQKIKAGDKLMSMDLDFIKNNAKSDISPIIFTNLEENTTINFTPKNIKAKENNIIEIRKNEN